MRVHEAVELAASDAPPPRHTIDDIVASGKRRRRRRRLGWTTAGGAALSAVAVAAAIMLPYAVGQRQSGRTDDAAPAAGLPAAPAAAGPFTFTFGAYDAGPFHVQAPITVSTAYQMAPVYENGRITNDRSVDPAVGPAAAGKQRTERQETLYAYLIVYRPGAYDPAKLKGARPATVNGRPALQRAGAGAGGMSRKTLAWQYAAGAWAVLESHSNSAADPSVDGLRGVAERFAFAAPRAARIPFTMSHVPAGYHPVEVGTGAYAGLDGIAAARDGDYGGAIFARPAPRPAGLGDPWQELPGSFQVFITPNRNSNQRLAAGQRPPSAPRCMNGFCNSWSPDGRVNIQVASGGRLTDDEMVKVLRGIRLADVDSPSGWPAADTAIPVK